MQRTNEPTDAVNTAEHPGAEMRLKGWSMDLGEQRKSIHGKEVTGGKAGFARSIYFLGLQ